MRYLLVLIILGLSLGGGSCSNCKDEWTNMGSWGSTARMYPGDLDQIFEIGSSPQFTCRILDPNVTRYDVNQLYLDVHGERFMTSSPNVEVRSDGIRLTVPSNLTQSQFLVTICVLKTGEKKLDCTILDRVSYRFGHGPVEPYNISCEILNWQKMVCSWEPGSQWEATMKIPTTTTLWWTSSSPGQEEDQSWRKCPNPGTSHGDHNCTWHSLPKADIWNIRMIVSNQFANITKRFTIDRRNAVRPNPLKDVHVTSKTPTTAFLRWTSPIDVGSTLYEMDLDDLIYDVTYTSQWDPPGHAKAITHRGGLNVTLRDLLPFSLYHVKVSVREVDGTRQSEPTTLSFRTPPDVPGMLPVVTKDSFEIRDNCGRDDCLSVTIRWQAVPLMSIHDEHFEYVVNVTSSCPMESDVKWTDKLQYTFSALNHCRYNVTVSVKNWHGLCPLTPTIIPIGRKSERPPAPQFEVISLSDSRMKVQLTGRVTERHDLSREDSLTVYWCLGSVRDPTCEGEMYRHDLVTSERSYVIALNDTSRQPSHTYIYGLAARSQQGYSSGISWAHCFYDSNTLAVSPEIGLAPSQLHRSISIQWHKPDCLHHHGYITSYVVSLCQVSDCHNPQNSTCIDKVESYTTSRESDEYTVEELSEDKSYIMWVRSNSAAGPATETSNTVCHTVTDTWLTRTLLAGILLIAAILSLLIFYGILAFCRYVRKASKHYQKGPDINVPSKVQPISVAIEPDSGSRRHSYENQFEEDWVIGKTLSVGSRVSEDSGRGSMPRQISMTPSMVDDDVIDDVFNLDQPLPQVYYRPNNIYHDVDETTDAEGYLIPVSSLPDGLIRFSPLHAPHEKRTEKCAKPEVYSNGHIPQSRTQHQRHSSSPKLTRALPIVDEESSGGDQEHVSFFNNPGYGLPNLSFQPSPRS